MQGDEEIVWRPQNIQEVALWREHGAAVLSTLNALGKSFRVSRRRLVMAGVAIKAAQRARRRKGVFDRLRSDPNDILK